MEELEPDPGTSVSCAKVEGRVRGGSVTAPGSVRVVERHRPVNLN